MDFYEWSGFVCLIICQRVTWLMIQSVCMTQHIRNIKYLASFFWSCVLVYTYDVIWLYVNTKDSYNINNSDDNVQFRGLGFCSILLDLWRVLFFFHSFFLHIYVALYIKTFFSDHLNIFIFHQDHLVLFPCLHQVGWTSSKMSRAFKQIERKAGIIRGNIIKFRIFCFPRISTLGHILRLAIFLEFAISLLTCAKIRKCRSSDNLKNLPDFPKSLPGFSTKIELNCPFKGQRNSDNYLARPSVRYVVVFSSFASLV